MTRRSFLDRRAFTLLELLAVIIVIAILASLLIPAFSAVQRSADKTKCASNLRQVGAAIAAYVGEHDGYLPGPLWSWQEPYYCDADYGTLAAVLEKYLKLPSQPSCGPRANKPRADVFVCPAWLRNHPYSTAAGDPWQIYILNSQVNVTCGNTVTPINPWGDALIVYQNSGTTSPDPYAGDKPRPVSALPDKDNDDKVRSASTIWAIQDYDLDLTRAPTCPRLSTDPNYSPQFIAPHPVHGNVRNTLFFDWHVEPVKVTTQ